MYVAAYTHCIHTRDVDLTTCQGIIYLGRTRPDTGISHHWTGIFSDNNEDSDFALT